MSAADVIDRAAKAPTGRASAGEIIERAATAAAIPARAGVTEWPNDGLLRDLWAKRYEALKRMEAAQAAAREAENSMPWWAQPGRSHLCADGRLTGPVEFWPADPDIAPPSGSGGVFKIIRRHLRDIKRDYAEWLRLFRPTTPAQRLLARAKYRASARRWIELQRAYRLERVKVDLDRLDRAVEHEVHEYFAIEDPIKDIRDLSPMSVAGRLLLLLAGEEFSYDAVASTTSVTFDLLEDLRPHLSGVLADHVDELLAANEDGDTCWSDLSWRG